MWEIFYQLTFSTARKVWGSFSQLKKDCWPFSQILASYDYFSIIGNYVRNIFSNDIFNCKKGPSQFFSTEERLLAIFQILASYGYFSIVGNHVRNIFSTDIFNGKKGSRQFFSTELITLILIKNFMMPN